MRAIGAAELFRPGLESSGLQFEEALGLLDHQPSDEGTEHATLVEFLDKGRSGMASTFLTRLRLGGKLVDAKGVSRLYRSRISSAALLLLVLAAFVAIGAALAVSEAGRTYLDLFSDKWDHFVDWLQDLF